MARPIMRPGALVLHISRVMNVGTLAILILKLPIHAYTGNAPLVGRRLSIMNDLAEVKEAIDTKMSNLCILS